MKIFNFIPSKYLIMMPIGNEHQELYEKTKTCYICRQKFEDKYSNDKNYQKIRDHCHFTVTHRGASNSICNAKYSITNEIPVAFPNGLNYDHHFIIKDLTQDFEGN